MSEPEKVDVLAQVISITSRIREAIDPEVVEARVRRRAELAHEERMRLAARDTRTGIPTGPEMIARALDKGTGVVAGICREAYRFARASQAMHFADAGTQPQLQHDALKSLVNWWNGSTADATHPLYNLVKQAGQLTGYGWRTGNVATEMTGVATVEQSIDMEAAASDHAAELAHLRLLLGAREKVIDERDRMIESLRGQLDAAGQRVRELKQRAAAPCGDCADPIAHIVNTLNKTNGNCAVLNMTCGDYAVTVNARKIVEAAKE